MRWPLIATAWQSRYTIENIFQFQDNITYEGNLWILGILNILNYFKKK